jgi:hypothetical protein
MRRNTKTKNDAGRVLIKYELFVTSTTPDHCQRMTLSNETVLTENVTAEARRGEAFNSKAILAGQIKSAPKTAKFR